jgi:hypothetical protein
MGNKLGNSPNIADNIKMCIDTNFDVIDDMEELLVGKGMDFQQLLDIINEMGENKLTLPQLTGGLYAFNTRELAKIALALNKKVVIKFVDKD